MVLEMTDNTRMTISNIRKTLDRQYKKNKEDWYSLFNQTPAEMVRNQDLWEEAFGKQAITSRLVTKEMESSYSSKKKMIDSF